jgi:hypothetical protein
MLFGQYNMRLKVTRVAIWERYADETEKSMKNAIGCISVPIQTEYSRGNRYLDYTDALNIFNFLLQGFGVSLDLNIRMHVASIIDTPSESVFTLYRYKNENVHSDDFLGQIGLAIDYEEPSTVTE